MLEMDEVRILPFQYLREGSVKKMVIVVNAGIRDPGQVVYDACDIEPVRSLYRAGKLLFRGVFFSAKDVDLMAQISQSLREIKGIKFDARFLLWRETVADLKDFHRKHSNPT